MAKKSTLKIICPHCSKNIVLDEVLTQSLEEEIAKKLEKEHTSELSKIREEIAKKDREIKKIKASVEEQIDSILKEEREKIEKDAKKKAEESISKDFKDLKEQLKEKAEQLKEAVEQELKLRKEKRELEEAKKNFELESTRKLDEERKKIYEEATKKTLEEHILKDKEREKQIDDLKKQIGELKRKADQGSQKLQGEVLEKELEQVLRDHFTQDEIKPISSGVLGADILQSVYSKTGKLSGSILIESKNAKNWSNAWIQKLKKDQREEKADIAVIATTTLPDGVSSFDCQEGIFIVHYTYIIPVIILLRNQLSEVARTKSFSIGKNEKIESLYQYLTGTEFKQKIESIVEAFANMHGDLQKEKRAMTKMWSKREIQIQQAIYGIAGMYGGMQGILGSSLPDIKSLEISDVLEEEKEEDK